MEAKLFSGNEPLLLSSSSTFEFVTRHLYSYPKLVSIGFPKPSGLQIWALAAKRSPKRLKYATPRFTKVFLHFSFSLIFLFNSILLIVLLCVCV